VTIYSIIYFSPRRVKMMGALSIRLSCTVKSSEVHERYRPRYDFNIGIDTSIYKDDWKGVSPICENVTFEFGNPDK